MSSKLVECLNLIEEVEDVIFIGKNILVKHKATNVTFYSYIKKIAHYFGFRIKVTPEGVLLFK